MAEGFFYLTSIMAFYSRKIIACTLSRTIEVLYVIETIHRAKAGRRTDLPLIIDEETYLL